MSRRPATTRVQIDELVLDGASAADAELVRAGLADELTRLLAQPRDAESLPSTGLISKPSMDARDSSVRAAAEALYDGLKGAT